MRLGIWNLIFLSICLLTLFLLIKLLFLASTYTYIIPVITINSQAEWKIEYIMIRWLLQKPANRDLHCFQKRISNRMSPDQPALDLYCFQKDLSSFSNTLISRMCCSPFLSEACLYRLHVPYIYIPV